MNAYTLRAIIANLISKIHSLELEIILEQPVDTKFGDYTTNVAMMLAKKLGRNPVELAGEIAAVIVAETAEAIESAVVAGPGGKPQGGDCVNQCRY